MTLLEAITAAARESAALAATPAPVDPAYTAYVAQVAQVNASRRACRRCQGAGYLREYAHINGGVCFACGGHSAQPEPVMSYREWVAEQALVAGFEGFDVMVQG